MNEGIKKLALDLARADTEAEVIRILKRGSLWNDSSVWHEYGGSSMNYSTIGNQQGSADNALVEKLVNSVDAVLMRECLERGIDPSSVNAPQSIAEAQKQFFGVYNGKLSGIDSGARSKLAKDNIWLIASGNKGRPSLSIVDRGEGQSPHRMPETLLSLTKSNKIKIPFVQGKFGMGGSGVLRFCSPGSNVALIISRRSHKIDVRTDAELYGDDDSRDLWGMTVVRREDPKGKEKSSHYTYLAPGGRIPSFTANELPLLPWIHPQALGEPLDSGTYIKLYEYEIGTSLGTNILFQLYSRLALLMPDIALPIRMAERRTYRANSFEATLAGLSVRLDDDGFDNLEPEFKKPSTGDITVEDQKLGYSIYVFKKGQKTNYAKREGVVFSVNGQAHGFLRSQFFKRPALKMDNLADSILVTVDCSKMKRREQEKFFMPSRDRLANGSIRDSIGASLEEIIKNHSGLKELHIRRRAESISEKLRDTKKFVEVLEEMIQKEPGLRVLFRHDRRGAASDPSIMDEVGTKKEYIGKEFPTYFKLTKDYQRGKPKLCPINQKFRIQCRTDAENDYTERDKDPGISTLELKSKNDLLMGETVRGYQLNFWNGYANFTVELPQDAQIGDELCFNLKLEGIGQRNPFSEEFWVRVERENVHRSSGGPGKRKEPDGNEIGKDRQVASRFEIPQPIEILQEDWAKDEYKEFKFDHNSALKIQGTREGGGYDFFINMDNKYLTQEIERNIKQDPDVLVERYRYGMVLLGMSVIKWLEEPEKKDADNTSSEIELSMNDYVSQFTEAAAQVLLPMVSYLGESDFKA